MDIYLVIHRVLQIIQDIKIFTTEQAAELYINWACTREHGDDRDEFQIDKYEYDSYNHEYS